MLQTLTKLKDPNRKSKIDLNSSLRSPTKPLTLNQSFRQRLFSISPEEATFVRRGFQGSEANAQQRLEQIGCTFLQGYHAAIRDDRPEVLVPQLNAVEAEWCGFAFEGAAMGLALLDGLTPWKRNRVQNFLSGAGADHVYMVHVGVGWALARFPWSTHHYLTKLDPLLSWLAIDGYGFHQGYFYWRDYGDRQASPKGFSGYASRVFDQGLGRSIWFVKGADVTRIPHTIRNFHPVRRADLWSGIGLACAYAGGVESDAIKTLQVEAGDYQPQLAQGAAFAAKARLRAGNLTAHTDMACQVLCGMSADKAAEITDTALKDLPLASPPSLKGKQGKEVSAYEVWQIRIQDQFALLGFNG